MKKLVILIIILLSFLPTFIINGQIINGINKDTITNGIKKKIKKIKEKGKDIIVSKPKVNVLTNNDNDTLPLPQEYRKKKYFEKIPILDFDYVYANTETALWDSVTIDVVTYIYSKIRHKYSETTFNTLLTHSGELVDFKYDYSKVGKVISKKEQKEHGLNVDDVGYKYFLDSAFVNTKLLYYVADNIDKLLRGNTVVLYNCNKGIDTAKYYYEFARERLESDFADEKYKLLSIQKISMYSKNICDFNTKDTSHVNASFAYLEWLKEQKYSPLKIQNAIYIDDIIIRKYFEKGLSPSVTVELKISFFNALTYTIGQSNYAQAIWDGNDIGQDIEEAIKKIINNTINNYLLQITDHFYYYTMDGHEFSITMPNKLYKENMSALENNLLKDCRYYTITSPDFDLDKDPDITFQGIAWVENTKKLMDKIKSKLPLGVTDKLKAVKGYTFYFSE